MLLTVCLTGISFGVVRVAIFYDMPFLGFIGVMSVGASIGATLGLATFGARGARFAGAAGAFIVFLIYAAFSIYVYSQHN